MKQFAFTLLIPGLVLGLLSTFAVAQPEDAPNQNPAQNFVRDGNWGNPAGGK